MRTFLRLTVSGEGTGRRLLEVASLTLWLFVMAMSAAAAFNSHGEITYLMLGLLVALFTITQLRNDALNRAHEQGLRSAINFLYSTRYMTEVRGLADRETFLQSLASAKAMSQRLGVPSVVITVELDNIQQVRDQFGDLVGSKAVRESARTLQRITHGDDFVAYVGWGRFAILLLECSPEQSTQFTSRIPSAIAVMSDDQPITLRVEPRQYDVVEMEMDELTAVVDGLLELPRVPRPASPGASRVVEPEEVA